MTAPKGRVVSRLAEWAGEGVDDSALEVMARVAAASLPRLVGSDAASELAMVWFGAPGVKVSETAGGLVPGTRLWRLRRAMILLCTILATGTPEKC